MKPPYLPSGERRESVTVKIPREATGLNAALYAHIEFGADGRAQAVTFSQRWMDDSTLDRILVALGSAVTETLAALLMTFPSPRSSASWPSTTASPEASCLVHAASNGWRGHG